jgi:tetratricopeptide (TPR) repeat protein
MAQTQVQTESVRLDAYLAILGLARQYKEEGLFSQAEDFYQQTIALARNLFAINKEKPRSLLIETLSELAAFYSFQGKDERSQPLWLEILNLGESFFKASDSLYVESVLGLARVKEKKGKYKEAEELYTNLLLAQETELGTEVLEICPVIKKAANFYFRQRNYSQAEALYLRVLGLEEYHLGTCSVQINDTVGTLFNVFLKQKKWRLAEYMMYRQKDILSILHGERSLCTTSCELRLAELFWQSGQTERAMRSYDIVLHTYAKMFGDRSKPVVLLKNKIASLSKSVISFVPEQTVVLPAKMNQIFMPRSASVLMAV